MDKNNKTICALSTPPGEGGIGIVRISGSKSKKIIKKIFRNSKGKYIQNLQPNFLYYGHIVDPESSQIIDEVLVVYMKSPKTYTREDVIEINSHSGYFVIEKILNLVLSSGSRLAEPGEFTKRAFLNGRISLLEAEAVSDLIKAKGEASHRCAQSQFSGQLAKKVKKIKEELMDCLSLLEANIDFSDQDIPKVRKEEVGQRLKKIKKEIEKLLVSNKFERIYREGINVAIVGLPNVGKSSLFNGLLVEERSIVTQIAGTTRDVIEETILIKGVAVKLTDTAGITQKENLLDRKASERSKKAILSADLIILIFDVNKDHPDAFFKKLDKKIRKEINNKPIVLVGNKIDLINKLKKGQIKDRLKNQKLVFVSAKTNQGIQVLEKKIINLFLNGHTKSESPLTIRQRHKSLLENVLAKTEKALKVLRVGFFEDLVIIDLREALSNILELTGEGFINDSEQVLNKIFKNFCIGK
jgi:tRNA modification GTPase